MLLQAPAYASYVRAAHRNTAGHTRICSRVETPFEAATSMTEHQAIKVARVAQDQE